MDLTLNNLQWLICHKTNQPTNQHLVVEGKIEKHNLLQLWKHAKYSGHCYIKCNQ